MQQFHWLSMVAIHPCYQWSTCPNDRRSVLGLFVVLNFVLLILRIFFFKSTLRSLCASHPFKASHAKFQMFQGRKTQHIKNDGVHKKKRYFHLNDLWFHKRFSPALIYFPFWSILHLQKNIGRRCERILYRVNSILWYCMYNIYISYQHIVNLKNTPFTSLLVLYERTFFDFFRFFPILLLC